MISETTVTGRPTLRKAMKPIGRPARSAMPRGGDVGGGGDQRRVAAEAGAE